MDGCIEGLDAVLERGHSLTNVGQGAAMDTVNLYEAKTNLSQLVERAAGGEEIIIAKAGRPLARLVPLAKRTAVRPLGLFADVVKVGLDFEDPLPDSFLRAFEDVAS
jgi:prevent-host-death family protein